MKDKDENGLNAREKRFADLVISGMAAGRAYEKAGYAARGGVADTNASRMLRNAQVASYIRAERKALSDQARIEKWQAMDFLTDAIITAVGDVDEKSILAQEVTTESIGEHILKKKVKMVSKLDSLKLLAAMLGWNAPEKKEIDVSDRLAEMVRLTRKGA